MSERLLLGIDAGTSVIKAALFDGDGQERAAVARAASLLRPRPDRCEMEMEATWRAAAAAVRQLLRESAVAPDSVAAVGVTGTMIGAWLIDDEGQPVRNAILWCDGRTRELVARLQRQQPGLLEEIYHTSGSVLEFGCTLPQLRWLAEHEPQAPARAATVLCCKDWLVYRLTNSRQLDPTEASVLPGDARARGYSDSMFARFGVEAMRPLFPKVRPSESIAGEVTPAAAAATGLAAGTPVVVGAGDVPSATLGAGAVTPGLACTVLGTTCHNSLVVAEPLFAPPVVGLLFCLPGGRWLRTMVNLAGTTNLDWMLRQLRGDAPDEDARQGQLESAAALAAAAEPGAGGLLYLPYLSPNGTIAPFVQPAARAGLHGLTGAEAHGDLLRAVYEGVALSMRDCYAAMHSGDAEDHVRAPEGGQPRQIRLVGGGSRSRFWSQLIADICGVSVAVPAGSEFGARGAALLAAVGLGWFPTVEAAATATTRIERLHEPNAALRSRYDALFQRYVRLRRALQAAWADDADSG